MKATLTFDLSEEREAFDNACNADRWAEVVDGLDQWLRSKLKYEDLSEAEHKAFEEARSSLHELLSDNGLSL